MKKFLIRFTILAVIAAGAWSAYRLVQSMPSNERQVATTRVRRGDVVVRSYTRGELRAVRSATLTAPNLFGTVQVTRLAPVGGFAREKDLVVEFDDSEVVSRVEEKQLEIDQTDEQIKKSQADLAIRDNQDQVDLLSAKFAVRRAELEVKRNELLSAIDAKKNILNLQEAQQRLKQLESDIKSRRQQAEAQLAVLQENKNKSLLELSREKQRLSQVKLLAPISGLVSIRQNRGNFMFPGMQIPDIREGDQVQPGIPVADVLDLSDLELVAKVGELDRANLREGQDATLALDALPEKKLHAHIKSMSGTASANTFSFDPAKKFDVIFSVDMQELLGALGAKPGQIEKILATASQNSRKQVTAQPGAPLVAAPVSAPKPVSSPSKPPVLAISMKPQFSEKELANAKLPPPPEEDTQFDVLMRPGLLADVEIIVEKIPNAIHVPMQAVFTKDGKQIVYVKNGKVFEPRAIQPLKRSESTMVISSGVKPGEIVALTDPTAKPGSGKKGEKQDGGGGGAMGALPGGGK
jgi:multidrug efflux pump subunit AcrA (membrane-fusion protein)